MARLVVVLLVAAGFVALIVISQLQPETNRVSGFIEADEVRLGSRVGGRVARVHVEEGQQVEAGGILVELEPFDLLEREREAELTLAAREAEYQRLAKGLRDEEIAQAKARYDQLQAKLELLEADPREQEVKAAQARISAAKAELRLAEQLLQRDTALFQRKAVTEEELERTRQAVESATATVVVRENELELLKLGARDEEILAAKASLEEAKQAWQMAMNGYRQEQVDQAKAARDAADAALEAIRRKKEELVIVSPLSGVVDSLDLQPGDMAAAGAPVMSVVDQRRLWVRAYVPQNRVGLRIGQKLRVAVASFPKHDYTGTVSYISRQAEFTPSNIQTPEEREKQVFRIKVRLDDVDPRLRPGMTADIWLDPLGEAP